MTDREAPLLQTRERIVALLQECPGLSLSELARHLGLGWGTVQHHVAILRKAGVLGQMELLGQHRLFSKGQDEHQARALGLLRHGRIRVLCETILNHPGITQKDLVERLGMTRKVLRSYVKILEKDGMLIEVRVGWLRTYRAGATILRLQEPSDPRRLRVVCPPFQDMGPKATEPRPQQATFSPESEHGLA